MGGLERGNEHTQEILSSITEHIRPGLLREALFAKPLSAFIYHSEMKTPGVSFFILPVFFLYSYFSVKTNNTLLYTDRIPTSE